MRCMQSGQGDLLVLHNRQPKWNEQLQAFCLNFGGRVTEASVKNFQLVGRPVLRAWWAARALQLRSFFK